MKTYLKRLAIVYPVMLIVVFMVGVLECSFYVSSVRVTLLEVRDEPGDWGFPGSADVAPDYRLCLQYRAGWETCETVENTPIGSGLTWRIADDAPPMKYLVRYDLVEEDSIMNKPLDLVDADSAHVSGDRFAFERKSSFDIMAGFRWFVANELWEAMKFIAAFTAIIGGGMALLYLRAQLALAE